MLDIEIVQCPGCSMILDWELLRRRASAFLRKNKIPKFVKLFRVLR